MRGTRSCTWNIGTSSFSGCRAPAMRRRRGRGTSSRESTWTKSGPTSRCAARERSSRRATRPQVDTGSRLPSSRQASRPLSQQPSQHSARSRQRWPLRPRCNSSPRRTPSPSSPRPLSSSSSNSSQHKLRQQNNQRLKTHSAISSTSSQRQHLLRIRPPCSRSHRHHMPRYLHPHSRHNL